MLVKNKSDTLKLAFGVDAVSNLLHTFVRIPCVFDGADVADLFHKFPKRLCGIISIIQSCAT